MAAGAFTYVCLPPIDAVKTKLQTKGAAQIYSGALDAAIQTFRSHGILGFRRGVSAVLVGSRLFLLSKIPSFPPLIIPPAAGAMGNIVSSAIMVPKELITQRMQTGAVGRSWEVLLRILEKDGILGLYAGYSATLLRNLPARILSYSSFEYMKGFVLSRTGKEFGAKRAVQGTGRGDLGVAYYASGRGQDSIDDAGAWGGQGEPRRYIEADCGGGRMGRAGTRDWS